MPKKKSSPESRRLQASGINAHECPLTLVFDRDWWLNPDQTSGERCLVVVAFKQSNMLVKSLFRTFVKFLGRLSEEPEHALFFFSKAFVFRMLLVNVQEIRTILLGPELHPSRIRQKFISGYRKQGASSPSLMVLYFILPACYSQHQPSLVLLLRSLCPSL